MATFCSSAFFSELSAKWNVLLWAQTCSYWGVCSLWNPARLSKDISSTCAQANVCVCILVLHRVSVCSWRLPWSTSQVVWPLNNQGCDSAHVQIGQHLPPLPLIRPPQGKRSGMFSANKPLFHVAVWARCQPYLMKRWAPSIFSLDYWSVNLHQRLASAVGWRLVNRYYHSESGA